MLFGSPESFAVEAVVEPGPEFQPVLGSNVVGRLRIFVEGASIGDFDEPACVLRALCDHLMDFCVDGTALWHESLSGLSSHEQFSLLDEALFTGDAEHEIETMLWRTTFLTNASEAFDGVKGFLVRPPGQSVTMLVRLDGSTHVLCANIPETEFRAVASQFSAWVQSTEHELLSPCS